MKSVAVIQREGQYFLEPFDRAVTGLWVGSSLIDKLNQSIPDGELGSSLVAMLKRSTNGVPHPDPKNWSSLMKPLYKAAGVRSWKALIRGAKRCSVYDSGEEIRFLPNEKAARGGSFLHLEELASAIPSTSTHEEIGQALRQALRLAK